MVIRQELNPVTCKSDRKQINGKVINVLGEVLGLASCHNSEKVQVRMADQAMYHHGNQSVFVGGRLWTLLPPPAFF